MATAAAFPQKKTRWVRNLLASAGVFSVGLVILAAIVGEVNNGSSGGRSLGTSAPPDLTVDAPLLFADYQADEVAADKAYKGKILNVSGTVDEVGKDAAGAIYVALSAGREVEIFQVQLTFSEAYAAQAAKLQKGDFIRARCRCEGRLGNIILSDCAIEAPADQAAQ